VRASVHVHIARWPDLQAESGKWAVTLFRRFMTQLYRRSPKSEKIAIRFDAIRHESLSRSLLAIEPHYARWLLLLFSLFIHAR